MRRQQSYSYPFPSPSLGRNNSGPHSGSVQSASVNPDEDWTKISDLAERRRIQNRIAQRNYRKKLKRRLEDLERRAGSTSPPPDQQSPQAVSGAQRVDDSSRKKRNSRAGPSPPGVANRAFPVISTGYPPREDSSNMFARQHTRQLSASPPPAFTYSFPTAEPATQPAPFHALPYPEYPNHPFYLPPLPSSRPGMGPFEATPTKTDPHFPDDDLGAAFSGINYPGANTGAEMSSHQAGSVPNSSLNVKWPPGLLPSPQPISRPC